MKEYDMLTKDDLARIHALFVIAAYLRPGASDYYTEHYMVRELCANANNVFEHWMRHYLPAFEGDSHAATQTDD